MSLDALVWAFNLELPNSGSKLVLLALANYANDDNQAYPSQHTISKKTSLKERAIRTNLVILEELGLISRVSRKRQNGSFTSDLFTVHVGKNITQRQILPTAENDKTQRQILPKPAADSAYPEEKALHQPKAKNNNKNLTFSQWMESVKSSGQKPLPKDHYIFEYIESVGLPEYYIYLSWLAFTDRYRQESKKYTDWRKVFANSVKNNWFKLWWLSDNGFALTTIGKQWELVANSKEESNG